MKAITDIETEEIRDLSIMNVPEPWTHLRNDDHIKSLVAKEIMVMMLTSRHVEEISGQVVAVPPIMSPLRDVVVTLVRKIDDLEGYVIDHPDCQECIDAVEVLRMSAAEETMMSPIVAVVQFTFDQVTKITKEEVES